MRLSLAASRSRAPSMQDLSAAGAAADSAMPKVPTAPPSSQPTPGELACLPMYFPIIVVPLVTRQTHTRPLLCSKARRCSYAIKN